MQKLGMDLSKWQKDFDFNQAKAKGIEFVIIKAGGADAGRYTDKEYINNYNKCKAMGMPCGAYYFGCDRTIEDAQKSAEHFISLLKGKQFEYPVYYDIEGIMLTLEANLLNQIIDKFCSIVQSAGYWVGIYASASPFKTKIRDSKFTHWVACYGKTKPSGIPYTDIWQFSGDEPTIMDNVICGVKCDLDYCYRDFPTEIKQKGLNGFKAMPTTNYLMTAKQFVDTLIHIVNCPTEYNNHYPKNLGYWDGARFSFDCWNLIKAVLNGWKDNRTVGYYQKDLSKTGDIDGLHILQKCTKTSQDFSQLNIPGTYLFMRNDHAGTYVGEHTINGHIVNVIECTSAWNHKVQWSYIDNKGNRYNYKGGSKSSRNWTDWGLMCWVDYSDTSKVDPIPEPPKEDKPEVAKPTLLKGNKGEEVLSLQQDLNYLGFKDENGDVLEEDGDFGNHTFEALKKYQKSVFPNQEREWDGKYGSKTYAKMQESLK